MQEGWQWLDYLKTGRVVKMDEVDENWAEVRIDFSNQARNIKGAYEARIEVNASVMTAWNSQKDLLLEKVKQYRVSNLVKVAGNAKQVLRE